MILCAFKSISHLFLATDWKLNYTMKPCDSLVYKEENAYGITTRNSVLLIEKQTLIERTVARGDPQMAGAH